MSWISTEGSFYKFLNLIILMSHLTVIVPTYNESGNMENLITQLDTELGKAKIPFDVLVMDDNSPDKTAEEVASINDTFLG